MSTKTDNYDLTKPEIGDVIGETVPALAENMDKIDREFTNIGGRFGDVGAELGELDSRLNILAGG